MLLASSFFFTYTYAQGEHARRIAAELTVLADDLRILVDGGIPAHHEAGLRQRMVGGLSALDILSRLADQELGQSVIARHKKRVSMRNDLASNRLADLALSIAQLSSEYPLSLPDIVIEDTSEFAMIHQSLCSSCHNYPDQSVERPAYNLASQSARSSEITMFARMLVGVRGDRITGIDNPFTDRQIMGLIKYYRDQ